MSSLLECYHVLRPVLFLGMAIAILLTMAGENWLLRVVAQGHKLNGLNVT